MDQKLAKTLAAPDFEAWRIKLWKEISYQAIGEGWVPQSEITEDELIDWESERWHTLWDQLVTIRYLYRLPVSRCVHAKFRKPVCDEDEVIGIRYLSFYTSPYPTPQDKILFEKRRIELLEWKFNGGKLPKSSHQKPKRARAPKCH